MVIKESIPATKSKIMNVLKLRTSVAVYLQDKWIKQRQKDPDRTHDKFGGYINDRLEKLILKEEWISQQFPNLSVFGKEDSTLYIKDNKIPNRFIAIRIRNMKLSCDYDLSECCDHIHFAYCQEELADLYFKYNKSHNNKKKLLLAN